MNELIFIGSACVDVVLRLPHLPARSGEDLHITGQQMSLGGCACNAFLTARQAGTVPCTLLAPVGSGVWGDWVAAALDARGVSVPIPRVPEENGCCYCLVEDSGERTFLSRHGAEYRFRREWLEGAGLTDAAGVYLCGLEVEEETGCELLDALEHETLRRLYFAPGPRIKHIAAEKLARVFALHPVLHLNEDEALGFTGAHEIRDAAAKLHGLTGNDVIVTLGGRGAYILTEDDEGVVEGVKTAVENTIGAGDSHIGAVMAREAAGATLRRAVTFANRVSAAVVAVPGTELPPETWQSLLK